MATKKRVVKESSGVLAFSALQHTMNRISSDIYGTLHANNLTSSQFGVLEALHKKGPLCQRDLAEEIMKTTGNITTVIDNLEKRELVERIRGKKDRRYFDIVLTRSGASLIKKFYPTHVKQVEKVMGRLTDEERAELVRICGKLEQPEG